MPRKSKSPLTDVIENKRLSGRWGLANAFVKAIELSRRLETELSTTPKEKQP